MNPALLTPSGLPRAGLVAWHDLYDPTTSLATVTDLSGKGNTLTLGSNPAAPDTNDPAWAASGLGLSFVDDDRGQASLTSVVDFNAGLTFVIAFASDYDGDGHVMSLRDGSGHHVSCYMNNAGEFRGLINNGTTKISGALIISEVTPTLIAVTVSGNRVVATNIGTGTASVASDALAFTVNGSQTLALGANLASSHLNDGTIYESLLYNRALTTPELQRIHRYVKAKWAARGVDVT